MSTSASIRTKKCYMKLVTPVVNATRPFQVPHARFTHHTLVCLSQAAVSLCQTAVYFRAHRRPLWKCYSIWYCFVTPVVNTMRWFWAPHARSKRNTPACLCETAVSLCEKAVYFFETAIWVQFTTKKRPPPLKTQGAICTLRLRKCSGLSFCTVHCPMTQVGPYRSDLWYTHWTSVEISSIFWLHPVGLEPARCTLQVNHLTPRI